MQERLQPHNQPLVEKDMTSDFQKLMNVPIDEIKPPPTLPPGTYEGIATSFEFGESSQKKTPYVQIHCQPTSPGDDVDMADYNDADPPIDLSKKQFRTNFYLTENAYFMLKNFLESFEDVTTKGRTLDAVMPEIVNKPILMEIDRNPNNDGSGYINTLKSVKGA